MPPGCHDVHIDPASSKRIDPLQQSMAAVIAHRPKLASHKDDFVN